MAIYNLQPDSRCEYCRSLFDPSVYEYFINGAVTGSARVTCKVCGQVNVIVPDKAKCPGCGDGNGSQPVINLRN